MKIFATSAAVVACIGMAAVAQDAPEPPAYENETIEEIIVVAGKRRGDPVDVEAQYEEMLRLLLLEEQRELRALNQENQWRSSGAAELETESRISWGYDPQDEMRMRRSSDLKDVQWLKTKPASLFRVEF